MAGHSLGTQRYGQLPYGGGAFAGGSPMAPIVINPVGFAWNGILDYLAGSVGAGAVLAANMAWGAINSHGSKAATLTSDGVPQLDLVGALNAKNGSVGIDINTVCNQLAGTIGLEATLALRTYAGLP